MLTLRALQIPPSGLRWTPRHRTLTAFMSSLPGMPEGVTLDQPTQSTSSRQRPPAPHQQRASGGQVPASSLQSRMDVDPELKAWDETRPPVGPETAYGPPNPNNPFRSANPISRGMDNVNQKLRMEELRHYGLYVKSTQNNTIATVSSPEGAKLKTYSGGICGFKGHRRSGYEAGYQCAVKAIGYLQELKEKDSKLRVNLYLDGFGQGRDAMQKALVATEGEVVRKTITRVTDITAMKIGGTRAKKRRRA